MPETRVATAVVTMPHQDLPSEQGALRNLGDDAAVVALDEMGPGYEVTGQRQRAQGALMGEILRELGVGEGDRVVGDSPKTPHAIISFLAAACPGAVWPVCGQDYTPKTTPDSFAQLESTGLIAADGYLFNGITHDRREAVLELASALPRLKTAVLVGYVGLPRLSVNCPSLALPREEAATRAEELTCTPVPFDHPLRVLFSSGTTGLSKGIVHGHGGALLEHLKTLGLQSDLGPGDRLLWYTTTHWMMRNLAASVLLTGATTCTYDGNLAPLAKLDVLWELGARHGVTVFGTSPQYLLGMAEFGIEPSGRDLSVVRVVGCTGSGLRASAYPWVRDRVGDRARSPPSAKAPATPPDAPTAPPTPPFRQGSCQQPTSAWFWPRTTRWACRGELAVTRPMPSMPLSFGDDPAGARYRVSRRLAAQPLDHGHRPWFGDRPRPLRKHAQPQRRAPRQRRHPRRRPTPSRNRRGPGHRRGGPRRRLLDAPLRGPRGWRAPGRQAPRKLRDVFRTGASPRHVPDEITEVPAAPYSHTGKRLDVPVIRPLQGAPAAQVVNPRRGQPRPDRPLRPPRRRTLRSKARLGPSPLHREPTTMPVQDRPPSTRPPEEAVALSRLRRTSGRLRSRLLAINLAAVGVPLLLALILGNRLTTSVSGPFTVGMLVLATGVLALMAAALWYDRACRAHCDPLADELRRRTPASGVTSWRRP